MFTSFVFQQFTYFCRRISKLDAQVTNFFLYPKLSAAADERADRIKLYKVMSIKDLQQQTPGKVRMRTNKKRIYIRILDPHESSCLSL